MTIRAAFFVDGFNAYHSIDDLKKPDLKWLDWWSLADKLIPSKSERLESVVLCTALKTTDPQKLIRHRAYLKALENSGVVCLKGHFAREDRHCRACGERWKAPVEKQGDINLAVALISGGYEDAYDHCYLVTADSDQAATARVFKEKFPAKQLTTVVITGRSHSKEILSHAHAKLTINSNHLERSLFPNVVRLKDGSAIRRPPAYDP